MFTTVLAATIDDVNPIMVVANYGVLGLFSYLLITGRIYTKSTVDVLNSQIQDLQRIINAFQSTTTNQTLPALARSTEVLAALPQEGASIKELSQLVSRLEELAADDGKKSGR